MVCSFSLCIFQSSPCCNFSLSLYWVFCCSSCVFYKQDFSVICVSDHCCLVESMWHLTCHHMNLFYAVKRKQLHSNKFYACYNAFDNHLAARHFCNFCFNLTFFANCDFVLQHQLVFSCLVFCILLGMAFNFQENSFRMCWF